MEALLSYILLIVMYFLGLYIFRNVTIIGIENIPRSIHVLIISNHRCFIDSFLIRIRMINLKELFFFQKRIPYDAGDKNNFFSTKLKSYFMKLLKIISVDREAMNTFLANKLIEIYCKILQVSNLILFPEGGRTKIGHNVMDVFKTGVAKTILIMTLREPDFKVVPIYIDEVMNEIMPREIGQKYLKVKTGKKGYMIIGEPVSFLDICIENISDEEKIEQIIERGRMAILNLKTKIPCE